MAIRERLLGAADRSGAAAGTIRLGAIDGLRAVAILAVVFYHFGFDVLASGFTGVDVFFVISGYVISRSLFVHGGIGSIGHYVASFYKRRIARLLPALVFCLTGVSLLSVMFIPSSFLSEGNRGTAVLAFFGLGNIGLLSNLDGYFGARAAHNPFVHTWSLGVEEQFYVFFPLLFWFWLKARAQPVSNTIGRFASLGAVPLLGLVSLGIAAMDTTLHPERAFYGLPSRFWELAAGATLFQLHSVERLIPQSRTASGLAAGLGWLALISGFLWIDAAAFPFPWALLPVIGTALLISAGRYDGGAAVIGIRILQAAPMNYIGRISYSLYLWHWPVACLFRWTVGFNTLPLIGAVSVLTMILAVISYHWIEQPFLRSRPISRQPAWQVILVGVAGTMVLAAGVNRLYNASGPPFKLSAIDDERGWEPTDVPPAQPRSRDVKFRPAHKVFVIGDSHAWAYTGMISRATVNVGADFQMMSVSGCPIASLTEAYSEMGVCPARMHETLHQLAATAKRGDIVFLASLRAYRLAEQDGAVRPEDLFDAAHQQARRLALDQARALLRNLQSLGVIIIIDEPKPLFRAPPFRCVDWFNRMNPVCAPGFSVPAALLRSRNAPIRASISTLKSEFPQLVVWDPFPVLCPGATCEAMQDGKPLFFDQDHLSGYGNLALEKSFTDLLLGIPVLHGRGMQASGEQSEADPAI